MEQSELSTWVTALATLIAAFFGSWSAYWLQDKSQQRKKHKENAIEGNRVLFIFAQRLKVLRTIQKQKVDPIRSDPAKMINMQAFSTTEFEFIKTLDFRGLDFLLETQHRTLLMELTVQELEFQQTIGAINERFRLHLDVIQPLLEREGIVEGGVYPPDFIKIALGNRLYPHLERLTNEIIDRVDRTIEEMGRFDDRLRVSLADIYPKAPFAEFDG